MQPGLLLRYRRLYSSLVSDCAEALGLGPRCAAPGLSPFHADSLRVVVGYAHTAQVHRTCKRVDIDMLLRLVERTPKSSVVVVAADDDVHGALWGGLMSVGVSRNGAIGAVIDGGVRDLHQIIPIEFPVWAAYRSPLDIRGRGEMVSIGERVQFCGVDVAAGDLVFADANGVVSIPAEAAETVLDLCEDRLGKEAATERELAQGVPVAEVYSRYKSI